MSDALTIFALEVGMPILILVIGPCGAGKTAYVREHFADWICPDQEACLRALAPDGQLHYYPVYRAIGRRMLGTAITCLHERKISYVLTADGETVNKRAAFIAPAVAAGYAVHVIRLIITPATCIQRAKRDLSRPATSRSTWAKIIQGWYRRWMPVDPQSEGIAAYTEVCNE